MKSSALDTIHRLLAESLYRGYMGAGPSYEEAGALAAHSARWLGALLLRLSLQDCGEGAQAIAETIRWDGLGDARCFHPLGGIDPLARPELECSCWPAPDRLGALRPYDEALWKALCEGRLVLRIEGSQVYASTFPKTVLHVVH